jgi:AsmA protein
LKPSIEKVKLMPLLDRRLEMGTVTVHGLALNLQKDGSGRTNWADLAPASSPGGAPAAEPSGGDDFSLAALGCVGDNVAGGEFRPIDGETGIKERIRISHSG